MADYSEGEDSYPGDDSDDEGFAIGKVVFPLDKQKDFVDTQAVLINDADTYIGKYLAEYLSQRVVGSAAGGDAEEEEDEDYGESSPREGGPKNWKVLGTMSEPEPKNDVFPFLWAIMRSEDTDAYMKELLKCGVIIYDITHNHSKERFAEIRSICDALRAKASTFKTKRIFILISTLHSWSETPPADANDEDASLSEYNYRFRRTKPLYRELQLLERYVVASGKMTKGMVKAYVIGAGIVYGAAEDPLHPWFKNAWHNAKHLKIYGDGKNYMPTIYIKDLARIIQHVMDVAPKKQRYIIAVDPVIPQQDQVVKAISDALGTGKAERTPVEYIRLNKQLKTFQADQILLNLRIETTFCQNNFEIDWSAEEGFPSIIRKLVIEYRKARNLIQLKIVIVGPPGSGKSTVARQISDVYRLHHFTKDETLTSTIELLRNIAGDTSKPDNSGVNTGYEAEKMNRAKELLAEVDSAVSEGEDASLPDDLIIKLFRYRLLTNPVQNQGFILDGFPENAEQAKMLFRSDEDSGENAEEDEGESGAEQMDSRLVPDRVLIFEAEDDFLKTRLSKVPLNQLEDRHLENDFSALLESYRKQNETYETTFQAFLDEREIIYIPIDVAGDTSSMMTSTVAYISSLMGKARNYGITKEEEEALRNAQEFEQATLSDREKEDYALLESQELEERRQNIQKWMEKLAKVKREEFERDEAALMPLRHYLMSHVVPTLTKGLIDVTRARPDDPIDFLAEFLFQNNPGGVNPFGDFTMK